MENPFTLTFGREPISFIDREQQFAEIIEGFLQEHPDNQVLILTGVRGSGKTVSLTSISNVLKEKKDWIVIDLNPERDMIQMTAAELSNIPSLGQLFADASLNLSVLGFGINIDGVQPITDIAVALDRMLATLTRRNRKVLLTIDEATSSAKMREFAAQFQIYIRKNYNIFLLMTGLFENVNTLQNEKTLTFLYRAPKIEMTPLSISLIACKYKEIFNLSDQHALEMAKATNGYAYAFQLLGHLCFRKKCSYKDVIPEYDACLESYVYSKIWSELSEQDRLILASMASVNGTKVESIRAFAGKSPGNFSVYRDRLIKKGLIHQTMYGHIDFTLPRFREFTQRAIDGNTAV